VTCSTPFTFGIALVPRASAGNWSLIEALLDLALGSVLAQTDQAFEVVIAGHDRPRTTMDGDPRLAFVGADWPVEHTGPHNDDSGRKKHALNDFVLDRGGGLFMLLDADDWVDRRLVEAARATIGPNEVGGLIDAGLVTDFRTLHAAPLPHPCVFPGAFHRLCGSSTVGLLRPKEVVPLRRAPFSILRSHHRWAEVAQERGAGLARLRVSGNYLINTSENHSEVHGPHSGWRQAFIAAVNREGHALDDAIAARFGLSLGQIRATSHRFR